MCDIILCILFASKIYASETKILENETACWACLFTGLCEGEYWIWATNPSKVPQNDTPNALFEAAVGN